ncbi:MAG: hypothetical protein E7111_03165 [Bacteroidales bacterium]|nr:hypothetical protein [Bacteroidales bacterium]
MKISDLIKLMSAAAIITVACEKPDGEGGNVSSSSEPPTEFASVTFEGVFADGTMLWNEEDAVKIVYSYDGSSAGEATVGAESAGFAKWTFQMENVGVGTNVKAVYPAGAEYPQTMTLPSEQFEAEGVRKYSVYVSDNAVTKKSGAVPFTLKCANAVVKFNFTTEEYSEYSLEMVEILADGHGIAGDWRVEENGEINIAKRAQDRISLTLASPAPLAQGASASLAILPVDLSGANVTVAVTLVDAEGTKVFLPLAQQVGKLAGGAVTEFDIDVSNEAVVDWYVMDDPREMHGFYAYGPANTVMVAKTKGAEGTVPCVIDVRPRGDFSKVRKPVYYGILTKADMNRKLLEIGGSNAYNARPTSRVSENCTITVDVVNGNNYTSTGTWGTVGIYDKDYNLLWSFMIFSYFHDDAPADVDCGGTYGKVMDRALGQTFSGRWLADEANKAAVADGVFTSAAYFQWGRKDPFMFNAKDLIAAKFPYTTTTGTMTIAETISNPYKVVLSSDKKDWCAETDASLKSDLWGAVSGRKTVFDPCPEGYKVMSAAILRQIDKDGSTTPETGRTIDETAEAIKYYYVDNPLAEGDLWLYTGMMWNESVSSGNNWANTSSQQNGQHAGYAYWANNEAATATEASWISFSWNGRWSSRLASKKTGKARGAAVRCIKEELPVEETPAE